MGSPSWGAAFAGPYSPSMPPREPRAVSRPRLLFVCVQNAGRSQMAAAFARAAGGDRVDVRSAGSAPADAVHPRVREAMAEVGIDLAGEVPKRLTDDTLRTSNVVVTMGCGDACP